MHHIDELSMDFIRGWTYDDKNPLKEIELDVFFEKKYLETIKSNFYREDLEKAFGNGNHSFKYRIPEQYRNKGSQFRIIRKDNQELILQGNLDIPKISEYNNDLIRHFGKFLDDGFWRLSKFSIDKNSGTLSFEGFSCAPRDNENNACFAINDGKEKFLCNTTFSENSTGVKTYFDLIGKGRIKLFKSNFDQQGIIHKIKKGISISLCSKKTLEPFSEFQTRYYVEDELPLPPPKNIKRVAGSENPIFFRIAGNSTFNHLNFILKAYLQKSFSDFKNICDFGCGCGRVTRYMPISSDIKVMGFDIDEENIEWCKKNLKNHSFLTIKTRPPIDIESNSFDLIIAVSVFTHLNKALQFIWLNELKRICKNSGIVLATINSDRTWFYNRTGTHKDFKNYLDHGIVDRFANRDFDGKIKEKNDYVNTLHRHDYIMKEWQKYFKIMDIISGAVQGNQDLVIMQKNL